MMNAGLTGAYMAQNTNRMADAQAHTLASAYTSKGMSEEQAAGVARDFESMFVAQMMEQMFGDSVGDDMFGDADTGEIYKGMLMEQYGRKITDSGGIGIADYVKKELLKLQEV